MPPIGMLTTDLALAKGDAEYKKLTSEYAEDLGAITKDFGEGWYQLMSRDMGQRERCLGDELPEMQAWETSLGPLKSSLPDYVPVRKMIQKSIGDDENNLSLFAQLAMQCSNTFRQTDYRGGCNGKRQHLEHVLAFPGSSHLLPYASIISGLLAFTEKDATTSFPRFCKNSNIHSFFCLIT
mmetsp:Transcript_30722/g.92000  ORF Transcript_30722/g.92000 Transcript_30722/m.92000 type:complete len:181 (-) Transcript_30722:914-1456(-)